MFVENTIRPTQSASLRDNLSKDSSTPNSFHDVFQQALNSKSNSRPPKLELSGLLMPIYKELHGRVLRFKLGTESNEYLLSMSPTLAQAAKNAEWEEVTVKGHLDLDNNVFDVEKLTLTEIDEPIQMPVSFKEPFDIDSYERIIHQRGKLEPAPEYLAS
jgi:hypothetical protein